MEKWINRALPRISETGPATSRATASAAVVSESSCASRLMGEGLIRDLEWLLALADHAHVTDAASALGASQPTLSSALARLEDEPGTRVFERVPSGIVRLAFVSSMATSLVPQILRGFHAHAPGLRVVLRQESAPEIVADLGTRAVDVAITSTRPNDAGIAWHVLQRERLMVVVPPKHRLRGRRRISLAELAGDELVTTPTGFGYRAVVEDLMAEARVHVPVSFESTDIATIESLVAAGLGVAIVPEAFAGVSGTVGLRIDSSSARRTIGLVWRTDVELSPPARRMVDFVRQSAGLDFE